MGILSNIGMSIFILGKLPCGGMYDLGGWDGMGKWVMIRGIGAPGDVGIELAPSCLSTSRGPAPVGGNKIFNATHSAYIIDATFRFVMGSIIRDAS